MPLNFKLPSFKSFWKETDSYLEIIIFQVFVVCLLIIGSSSILVLGSFSKSDKSFPASAYIADQSQVLAEQTNSVPTGTKSTATFSCAGDGRVDTTVAWPSAPDDIFKGDSYLFGIAVAPGTGGGSGGTPVPKSSSQSVTKSLYSQTTYNWAVWAGQPLAGAPIGDQGTFTTPDCPDDKPPSVKITKPAEGATVSDGVNVYVQVSDGSGIASVTLYVDGQQESSQQNPLGNASFTWDSTKYSDSQHTLTAGATDKNNNSSDSSPVSVTVDNSSGGGDSSPTPSPDGSGPAGEPLKNLLITLTPSEQTAVQGGSVSYTVTLKSQRGWYSAISLDCLAAKVTNNNRWQTDVISFPNCPIRTGPLARGETRVLENALVAKTSADTPVTVDCPVRSYQNGYCPQPPPGYFVYWVLTGIKYQGYGAQALLKVRSPDSSPAPAVSCAGPLNILSATSPVAAGANIQVELGNLGGCDGKVVWGTVNGAGQPWQKCTVSGSGCTLNLRAPSSAGQYRLIAATDLNGDGRWYTNGEFALATVEVTAGTVIASPTPTPAPESTSSSRSQNQPAQLQVGGTCRRPLAISSLTPNPVATGKQVTVTIGNLKNCNGQTACVYLSGQTLTRYQCPVSGSGCSVTFSAPQFPGNYKVVAVVDLDRDGKWYESGEYAVGNLAVNRVTSAIGETLASSFLDVVSFVKNGQSY